MYINARQRSNKDPESVQGDLQQWAHPLLQPLDSYITSRDFRIKV